MKRPLIILTGPTAVGKTSASINLAKAVNGEIISADSMQVYRHMDIGSAKIRAEEMEGIRHHLIDILEPDEEFHVVRFQQLAKQAMEEIYGRGRIRSLSEAPDSTFRRYFTILILQKMTEIQRIEKNWKHWRRSRAQRHSMPD